MRDLLFSNTMILKRLESVGLFILLLDFVNQRFTARTIKMITKLSGHALSGTVHNVKVS